MPLPQTFSELYPNGFLHADQLRGKKVTVTIKDIVLEEMENAKGKKKVPSVSFAESPLKFGANKTNGYCLKRMFGSNPHDWLGKKITIFETTTRLGPETVPCIRIWGSPEIAADMKITVPQGRNKPIEMTMHKVRSGERATLTSETAPPSAAAPEPASPEPADFPFEYQPVADDEA